MLLLTKKQEVEGGGEGESVLLPESDFETCVHDKNSGN